MLPLTLHTIRERRIDGEYTITHMDVVHPIYRAGLADVTRREEKNEQVQHDQDVDARN